MYGDRIVANKVLGVKHKINNNLKTSQRIGKLHQIMRQYFYLIGHSIVGDDLCMDKVFMQKSDAISYGKRLANKNPEFSVILYKQLMSNSSKETIKVVKQIPSTKSIEEFDWDIPKGADFDIEIPW